MRENHAHSPATVDQTLNPLATRNEAELPLAASNEDELPLATRNADELPPEPVVDLSSSLPAVQNVNLESETSNVNLEIEIPDSSRDARPIRNHRLPAYLNDYAIIATNGATPLPVEPKMLKTAFKDCRWVEAMQDELYALHDNNTWELVPRPPSVNVQGGFITLHFSDNPNHCCFINLRR
ncbi:hypothetical protein LWI29_027164 [Acer saccharum]|uniref:Uncharacterized protein n=1 Tax=Acer saccharum TaxID=4024 RepID=A0AA39RT80_ACESA|nr:hypothetical protein LWI29_027164 [Acer saccharum]